MPIKWHPTANTLLVCRSIRRNYFIMLILAFMWGSGHFCWFSQYFEMYVKDAFNNQRLTFENKFQVYWSSPQFTARMFTDRTPSSLPESHATSYRQMRSTTMKMVAKFLLWPTRKTEKMTPVLSILSGILRKWNCTVWLNDMWQFPNKPWTCETALKTSWNWLQLMGTDHRLCNRRLFPAF